MTNSIVMQKERKKERKKESFKQCCICDCSSGRWNYCLPFSADYKWED